MAKVKLLKAELSTIEEAVEHFKTHQRLFENLASGLRDDLLANEGLNPYIHFVKWRIKDPDTLREKLKRKALERKANGRPPNITARNLFMKVTDLAGVRLLHLHTEQMREMVNLISEVLLEKRYRVREGPKAMVWDSEYEELFQGFGITPERRRSMYTSVHYVVEPNRETKVTAELQVRTLMEEVWGEVSHRVDYPSESMSRVCKDELKVLARMTSGCTRLVDSIFKGHSESKAPPDE